ncbi:HigA family addiction module antitoxin [Mycolicibacterium obuense]|uniref:HigA family addiction module antidote protein n=1 Tax=Mycolicibacterium obuense TaxID=1807 RepID=A0A0M2K6H9_9MYCO|nr:HigA family addiction module antitoxin [Mycolicibacterium obuense]KKF02794.1 HigA family addiction module antidote protein [Mycolicibacterium obuense]
MSATNYAVAPGEYLEEWITEHGLSQQRVAEQLGCSRKQVNEIVNGRAPVTSDTAIRLERVVGIPADSWLRYEAAYRADLARIADLENLASHADKIDPSAVSYLRSLGATKSTRKSPGSLVSDFLTFHRCGTWDAYVQLHETASSGDYALAALKESGDAKIDTTVLTTWLRAGEMTEPFERGGSYEYDPEQLRFALPLLRSRAAVPDETMLRDLANMLADVGVVFMVVPPPKRFPLHGMTRWIDKRVPVVQQTGRWGKDGFVIWALFHELGHVLNDPRGEMHLEYTTEKKRNTDAEKSANKFAMDVLFGESGIEPFAGLTRDSDIARTARQVGIAPGVAVFQMHRRRLLHYRDGNRLCVDLAGTFTA